VLADIEAGGGVEGYLVLGDLLAIGYDPAGVLIARLPQVRQLWPLIGAGGAIRIQLHQRHDRHAQFA
jgi:hypothetical protein